MAQAAKGWPSVPEGHPLALPGSETFPPEKYPAYGRSTLAPSPSSFSAKFS
ncbi:hypothetical protein STBA_47310 [Streptomyces sp. MP131-18]|nr:hypothetical protein STBA_47310 [Streptomyces sp. MP131-18]